MALLTSRCLLIGTVLPPSLMVFSFEFSRPTDFHWGKCWEMNSRKSSLNKCETGRIKMMKAKTGTIVPVSGRRRVSRGTRAIMTGRRRVLDVLA